MGKNIYQNNKIMKKENKKQYIAPKMEMYGLEPQSILAVSGVENVDYGIRYGGIDQEGDMDAE